MKTSTDPRHLRRREAVKSLFAQTFIHAPFDGAGFTPEYSEFTQRIILKQKELDKKIEKAAPEWPIANLNKIDLAILRLAIYELSYGEAPAKVVIDEAVELAKEYGSETSSSFINGVLGTIYSNGPRT